MTPEKTPLTVEDVATIPPPGLTQPASVAFSPDDRLITFLFSPEGILTTQLYAFDMQTRAQKLFVAPPATGTTDENVSLDEALRRERQRQWGLGVTTYAWPEEGNRVLIPLPDGIYVHDADTGHLRRVLASDNGPILDPAFSPDGQWIACVRDSELYVIPAGGGETLQVTSGARGTGKTNGLAEYVAQEEMGRPHGFWWSPDGSHIAFTEVDETHIPVYRIVHQGKDIVGQGAQEDHRYPFAGHANAHVRLGVISRGGGDPIWMDLGDAEYLARVHWFPDGRLGAQLQNREQTELELVCFDPGTGQRRVLVRETNRAWINLHHLFHAFKLDHSGYAGGFIWGSERDGFQHLYLYDERGQLIRQLTHGDWLVERIAAVDEDREIVYFTGTRESPLESHLYAVPLAGGEPRRLTLDPGMHSVVVDHGFQRFVDCHDSLDRPPSVTLRSLSDGSPICSIYGAPDARLDLKTPEIVQLHSRDGALLYGALYRPPARFGAGPRPAIISVYGGPHVQNVCNGWRLAAAMRAQYLCSLGFVVFVLDNRGSARRGLAFEAAVKGDMGHVEVADQVDGVRWLVEQGLADPQRVGIYGWSYGGYMSAMCLVRAPDTFKVAVAGAPVTHWDGYDTHYTERYMGLPHANVQGYADSSVEQHVAGLVGKLLLVHGLIDENVHFRHTARLVNALIRARKPYDLMLFPDERHMPRRLEDRVFMEERIRDYFLEHLL